MTRRMSQCVGRVAGCLMFLALSAGTQAQVEPAARGWGLEIAHEQVRTNTTSPSAAFALPEGSSLSPYFEAREWSATYSAMIDVSEVDQVRFGVEIEGGEASLVVVPAAKGPVMAVLEKLSAKTVTGPGLHWTGWLFPLGYREVRVDVTFRPLGEGPVRLRTLWESSDGEGGGFPAEPVPSRSARPNFSLERWDYGREGRQLLETKGCTNCHLPDSREGTAVGQRSAPRLEKVGERLTPQWMRRWIIEPSSLQAGADMPALFGNGTTASRDVDAILGLLASWASPESSDVPIEVAELSPRARTGRSLYHRVGCVACHGALGSPFDVLGYEGLDRARPEASIPFPFGHLEGKWTERGLDGFLLDPLAVYPDGRMPSLDLDEEESQDIATFLVEQFDRGQPAAEIFGDPAEGWAALARGRCVACHEIPDAPPALPSPGLSELSMGKKGCLDPNDDRTPRYDLTDEERLLLERGVQSFKRVTGAPAPLDEVARSLATLGCLACHAADGEGGVPASLSPFVTTTDERVDLGDEGRYPPDLSGVGERLSTSWLKEVLMNGERSRPWLATRMPHFEGDRVEGLAEQLALREGLWPHEDEPWPVTGDDQVLAGRALAGADGLGCVQCHNYKDYPVVGSPGLDMTQFSERLRYDWYRRFLLDPQRWAPGTRMPAFHVDGKSTYPDLLGGDATAQIDALWSYFSLEEFMPVPGGVTGTDDLQIDVGQRPVVLRTFLEEAGSRGIAVGFPVGVHFSFDGEESRLSDAWQGDFLEVSGAWAGRGGQVTGGRGPVAWSAPSGPPILVGEKPDFWPESSGKEAGYRFAGYRLDQEGVPTFLYSIDGMTVEERIVPKVVSGKTLVRTFTVTGLTEGEPIWVKGDARARLLESEAFSFDVFDGPQDEVFFEVVSWADGGPLVLVMEIVL